MKQILAGLFIITIFIFCNLSLRGQNLPFPEDKYSILGDERNKVYEEFTSTETEGPPEGEEESYAASYEIPLSSETEHEYDLELPTTTPQGLAGNEFLDFLQEKKFFHYNREEWLKMKKQKEKGLPPGTEAEEVGVSTRPVSLRQTLPPGLAVELPYESQLSISGRKLIGTTMKSTIYDQPLAGQRVNSTNFSMDQQMQVRIKGTVGRKVNVDVNFDDTSSAKQDISVVYKGDPDEFVQEAAFGDVLMSLPSTEFVGYSKQLFGIKMDTKYKSLRTMAFFSQTKGLSEVKRFTGNTQFVRNSIADTSYIPYKYYSLNSSTYGIGTTGIKAGTVKVYIADFKNPLAENIVITTGTVLESLLSPGTTDVAANFYLMVPGQDYVVDYNAGVVSFRNTVGSNYLLAVDYQLPNGTMLSSTGNYPGPKIIKDDNNTYPGTSSKPISTELRNYYNLGNVKIQRDNGRGNFILQVRDLNNSPVTNIGVYPPIISPPPGAPPNMNVDFDNGIVYFPATSPTPFPSAVYTSGSHLYNIYTEYRYLIKILNLRPGIVPNSEKVTMNGIVLKKNEDYLIDYDVGIVTLYNTDRITDSTVIDISYDYAPFGSSGASTLLGMRAELSLTRNFFVGSSVIYNFASQTSTIPDIRSTPSSLLVAEADSRVQDIKVPGVPLKLSVSGEYATSQADANVMDKALVESMDGINQTDSLSFFEQNWMPAAAPNRNKFYLNAINVTRVQVYRRNISPGLENQTDEQQDVINFNYDLTKSNGGELSMVQVISKAGLDYSQKLYIETWINGDGKGENLSFEYGQFDEDVDGSGILRTEDKHNDGTLDAGEDIGWQFINPDGTISTYGAGNGRLDTEDWLGTGIISLADIPASAPFGPGTYINGVNVTDSNGVTHSSVDWTGWRLFKIPLNITSPDAWKNIRQFRITISGSGQVGTVSFGEMSIIGIRWKPVDTYVGVSSGVPALDVSTVSVSAINTDDPRYVSLTGNPVYQQLYGSTNSSSDLKKKEQALSIKYQVTVPTSTVQLGANEVFAGTPLDFSPYQDLNFFVYPQNSAVGDTLFLQAGGDDANYFEYAVPIQAAWANSWRNIIIQQQGTAGRASRWIALDPNATVTVVGNPSLNNISQIKTGVRVAAGKITNPAAASEIWVDKIYVTNSFKKNGEAKKINMDLAWQGSKSVGSITLGGGRKEIDRNFETFSPGVYDRDYLEDNVHMSFGGVNTDGLSLFPTSARFSKTQTVTPSIVQQTSNLISTLDEGTVTNYTASGDTSLRLGKYLPVFGGGYSRAIIDTTQIAQLEDRETVSGNIDYTSPLKVFLLPTGISSNYSVTNSYFKLYPSTPIAGSNNFLDIDTFKKYLDITDYHTLDVTETWGMRTPFRFGNVCNFQPSYNISTVREKDKDFSTPQDYFKSLNQNVAGSASFRFFPWLQPNANYNVTTLENYSLTSDTTTNPSAPVYPGQTKYIERDDNGELSWNFQVRDVLKIRYLASLGFTSSYKIQDSDSYDNVPANFNPLGASLNKLWIRGNDFNQAILNTGTTTFIFKTYSTRDDLRVAGRFNPLEAFDIRGRLDPLKTLSTNFTYTGTNQHSLITGTQSDVITRVWPDLLFGMNKLEKMIFLDRWISDSVFNFRQQTKTVDTLNITHDDSNTYGADWRFHIFTKYDLSLAYTTTHTAEHDLTTYAQTSEGNSYDWSTQAGTMFGKWRCVLRVENSEDWLKNPDGVYTAQLSKNIYSAVVNADMSFPGGIPLPFTRARLNLKNRLIVTGNLTYSTQTSVLDVATNNIDNYSVGGNADYEISDNFRLSVGSSLGRTIYTANQQANVTVLQITSSLNIQF